MPLIFLSGENDEFYNLSVSSAIVSTSLFCYQFFGLLSPKSGENEDSVHGGQGGGDEN